MSDFHRILHRPILAATTAINLGIRTHAALSRVVIEAFKVLPSIRQDQDEFINFARSQYGLTVKGRTVDPITLLLIKLLFLNSAENADMRRKLGQLTTALNFLDQNRGSFPAEHAARFLHDCGGISGCVKAWRKANSSANPQRAEQKVRAIQSYVAALPQIGTTTHYADHQCTTINDVKDSQTLEALVQSQGRVLIVGDIDDQFNLVNLRVVERDQDEIDRLLTRKAAQVTKTGSNDNQPMKEAI
jgi:hypothetical protein